MFQLAKTVSTYLYRMIDKHWLEEKARLSKEKIAFYRIAMEPFVQYSIFPIVSAVVGCVSVYVQRQR
jgi:hypothetical protein